MQRCWLAVVPWASLLFGFACGDDGSSAGGQGAGTGGAASCPDESLCLDVVQAGEPAAGRLAVVWFRFEDDEAHDPTVGFERAFDVESESVVIPLAEVALPPDFDLLCERPCAEPMSCPCIGDFEVGVAYVIVAVDEDASGSLDLEELDDSMSYVGIANTALVWSASTEASAPEPFTPLFPEGVTEGIGPYRIVGGAYEPAAAGSKFELRAGTEAF